MARDTKVNSSEADVMEQSKVLIGESRIDVLSNSWHTVFNKVNGHPVLVSETRKPIKRLVYDGVDLNNVCKSIVSGFNLSTFN